MKKVLIVEDSRYMARTIAKYIRVYLGHPIDIANNYTEAEELLKQGADQYLAALLDLHLPDCERGAVVDLALSYEVPSIVFTSYYDEEFRNELYAKNIVDYVIKKPENLHLLMRLIKRIENNSSVKALVVDDSTVFRNLLTRILKRQRLNVFSASDGREALDILAEHPDVRLVMTDYNMPTMDGYEFLTTVRERHKPDEMLVIVISSEDKKEVLPKFLKNGANDYVHKDSTIEEILCRVNMNLDMLELIDETRAMANKDPLTGLFNRRYFFEHVTTLYQAAKASGEFQALAMVDIDHFKKVNDTYGHQVGDQVIKNVADLLKERFPSPSVVSRFGGEEFCIYTRESEPQTLYDFFDTVRKATAEADLVVEGTRIAYSVSIGVTMFPGDSLEDMIKSADRMLYEAKNEGRDLVCIAPC